jgi:aquaporin Z
VEFWDGLFYIFSQLLGAISGVALARYVLRGALSNYAVHYAVTVPGVYGCAVAFMAELTMSLFRMVTVLFATNQKRLAPYTAYFVGALIAMFYPVRAALSGMSTNPARSFGPAGEADSWRALVDLFHRSVDGHAGGRCENFVLVRNLIKLVTG